MNPFMTRILSYLDYDSNINNERVVRLSELMMRPSVCYVVGFTLSLQRFQKLFWEPSFSKRCRREENHGYLGFF